MVNVRPDRNFEYPLLHSKASQRINPLPQTIKGNCYFYWFVTEFGQDQHISILTENYCQEKNSFPHNPALPLPTCSPNKFFGRRERLRAGRCKTFPISLPNLIAFGYFFTPSHLLVLKIRQGCWRSFYI
jgi:hypothetical protein